MPKCDHQRIAGIDVDIDRTIRRPEAIGQTVLPIHLQCALVPYDSLSEVLRCIVHLGNSFLFTSRNFSFLIADLGIAAHIGIGDFLDTSLSVYIGNGVLLNGKPSFLGFPLHLLRLRLHIGIELGSSLFSCSSDTLGIFRLRYGLFARLRNVPCGYLDGGNVLRRVAGKLNTSQPGEGLSCRRIIIDAGSYALVSLYTGKSAVVGFLSFVDRIINCGRKSLSYAILGCFNGFCALCFGNGGSNSLRGGFHIQLLCCLCQCLCIADHCFDFFGGDLCDIPLDF